jgi:hypothetical protein
MTTPHDLEVCFRDMIGAAAEAIGWDVSAMLRDTERVRYAITVGTNAALQRQAQARPADRRAVVNSDAAQSGRRRLRGCGDGGAGGRRDRRRRSETSSNEARGHVSSLTDASRERAVRDLFEDTYAPGCIDGVPVDIGRDVVGDASLPRRTATVLFNAYVHPDVGDFLYRARGPPACQRLSPAAADRPQRRKLLARRQDRGGQELQLPA